MPNPQVFRVSLVVMVFADFQKRSSTPEPFLECRSFLFLDHIPNPMQEIRIKKMLKDSIEDDIMGKFIPHIFDAANQSYNFLTRQTAKPISLKQMTNRYKVEIEGFEVEQIDLDEIFHEKIYWSERPIGGTHDHLLFTGVKSNSTIRKVIYGGQKLHLNLQQIYRYVAFYNERHEIDGEYDEFDIRKQIGSKQVASAQQAALARQAIGLIDSIESKTTQLKDVISELERLAILHRRR
jgi:hypothetical protein